MKARPIQSVDERGQLRGREPHHAIADRRPSKRALLEPLPNKHKPGSIAGQNLQTICFFRAEDENRPQEGITLKFFTRKGGKTVGAPPEVHRLRRYQHPHTSRNRDHVAAFTARSTAVSVASRPRKMLGRWELRGIWA